MSNTVITNYTDLNGPSTKADSSVVVIVNKDGSLSVDHNLLGTLMGTDGSQSTGISVVRVGHEGRPDDATDSETEDDKIPHVTLSVDSYYDEPNSIIKYDSGAEMLQSLRIETRENSLLGFQNDHCYTPLTSPSQAPQRSESYSTYDEPVIEITHTPPPKPVPTSKKITILEQQIIPKGKKIMINSTESPIILKGNDVLNKPLKVLNKKKGVKEAPIPIEKVQKGEDSSESSSISSSGDSIPDRDSDSDYKDFKDKPGSLRLRNKHKLKPRILKTTQIKGNKLEPKMVTKLKANRSLIRKDIKEKHGISSPQKNASNKNDSEVDLESLLPSSKILVSSSNTNDISKVVVKTTPKPAKKEKKPPAHMTALLSDMTSLFSTPDVIRRVSTDNKPPGKSEKEAFPSDKKTTAPTKPQETEDSKILELPKPTEAQEKIKTITPTKTYVKKITNPLFSHTQKTTQSYDLIPQLDDASLAQILQDTTGITSNPVKTHPAINTMSSPGLVGPLSPTLDLLGGLQSDVDIPEDLLMHVAQLVESSENLQEVIDKQVLGKVDTPPKPQPQSPFQQQAQPGNLYIPTLPKPAQKTAPPREIIRRDGRVITLPPIEAPATRASKRKSQMEGGAEPAPTAAPAPAPAPPPVLRPSPEPQVQAVAKQYPSKKLPNKKPEPEVEVPPEKTSAESQESWNSEDDPYRLWCICKQPHNNRFMICCDSCEDWFHGKCVNITKAMGQQMEERGIEWRCPKCIKEIKTPNKPPKVAKRKMGLESPLDSLLPPASSKTNCIVCKRAARASSIYCSDACILRHAQESLAPPAQPARDRHKPDSRVVVYERKSGRLLAGPNAPTAENLKAWLQKNPTFEVVRPGALSAIRPNPKKRAQEPNSVQTTLNFQRIPKKVAKSDANLSKSFEAPGRSADTPRRSIDVQRKSLEMAGRSGDMVRRSLDSRERTAAGRAQADAKARQRIPSPKEERGTPKTPTGSKPTPAQYADTPRPGPSGVKPAGDPRKLSRTISSRSQSVSEKPAASPARRRDKEGAERGRMGGADPIRDNVRKSLQEQLAARVTEDGKPGFSDKEIEQFAFDTEAELHELFRDVGVKYKAKYRSLMFNIKDRKNQSLWHKICDKSITPKQLVRLSPEELASQELAQWREDEVKHQLELIKKSELDLLAANKTYVLKTHKGEEVMENKESVSTELDPNVRVEDVVLALNDSAALEEPAKEDSPSRSESPQKSDEKKHKSSRKRDRAASSAGQSKKSRRDSRRDSDSRRTRRRSVDRARDSRDSRESRRASRRSERKDRSPEAKEKESRREKSRRRSRSRSRPRRSARDRKRSPSADRATSRSKSQENVYKKTDSTDSESLERPKSAQQKEAHPAYDPHEPMITSACSEEDLRKAGEDAYDDQLYKSGLPEYEPATTADEPPATPVVEKKQEKISETESDQEPTSTVESSAATIWNGCINMVDVARFYVAAYEVSGSAVDLEEDLSTELDIVGRINPDTVWDYIEKMKKASNKDIVVLRLQAANDEEKMQYIALYSYLSSRNRLGVVKVTNTANVKDFYIVPLPAHSALPGVLRALGGPGAGDARTHLLLAIVIRQRRKRAPGDPAPKVARVSRKQSYTPPIVGKSSYTPPASPKRRPLPLPTYGSAALSTSVKDKIAASLACADDEEAYSPGSSHSSGSAPAPAPPDALRHKMEELNRQIEEQKQQIMKMAQADSSVGGEDEAYSPSRPMTPPVSQVPLADIALPSNLQDILDTIKQRETTSADVDMRSMQMP